MSSPSIFVVIPCYRVRDKVLGVIAAIGSEVRQIIVVDDACPEGSGEHVRTNCQDPRVRVIFHEQNKGVGGAVLTGYKAALESDADVIVKIDGDGQMDPAMLPHFVDPILRGEADYTKGNRFFTLEYLRQMPRIRLFGNAVLSFMAKFSTGYWDIFDPTNGYTAICADVARILPLDKISQSYFFETDMLFHLNVLRAVVVDVTMKACYGDEKSNMKIRKVLSEFLVNHIRNFFKRIFYNYYLRDMSVASIELPLGAMLIIWGLCFGSWHWMHSRRNDYEASAGTVMLSVLPIILGLQFLISFLSQDMSRLPRRPLQLSVKRTRDNSPSQLKDQT